MMIPASSKNLNHRHPSSGIVMMLETSEAERLDRLADSHIGGAPELYSQAQYGNPGLSNVGLTSVKPHGFFHQGRLFRLSNQINSKVAQ
jgi:hypothetical protein